MLTLYHAPNTRSVKVRWLLEEMGINYRLETRELQLGGGFHSQNVPGGKFPAVTDGDVVMNESAAIMEYILDRYGPAGLAPARDSSGWPLFLQWLHYAESTAFPVFQNIAFHSFQLAESMRAPVVVANETPWAKDILKHIDQQLAAGGYLLGSRFSAADIQLGFAVFMAQRIGLVDGYSHVAAWLQRLQQRPALARALAEP